MGINCTCTAMGITKGLTLHAMQMINYGGDNNVDVARAHIYIRMLQALFGINAYKAIQALHFIVYFMIRHNYIVGLYYQIYLLSSVSIPTLVNYW